VGVNIYMGDRAEITGILSKSNGGRFFCEIADIKDFAL
jgi:enoyl-CoA hydratase/carnithine racemase